MEEEAATVRAALDLGRRGNITNCKPASSPARAIGVGAMHKQRGMNGDVAFLEDQINSILLQAFSPCNMHIRVDVGPDRPPFVFFLIVCVFDGRVALSLHCLPTSEAVASQVAATAEECTTLESLLEAISAGGEVYTSLLSKMCTFLSVE